MQVKELLRTKVSMIVTSDRAYFYVRLSKKSLNSIFWKIFVDSICLKTRAIKKDRLVLAYCLLLVLGPFFLSGQDFKKLDQLNSPHRETNLSITPNGKYLYFMSQRGEQPWSTLGYSMLNNNSQEFDGDIYYSVNKNGVWQKPQVMNYPISTSRGEDEPSISMDGQTVYFQSWRDDWVETGGPYYKAELKGQKWLNPKGLGGNITEFFINQYRLYDYVKVKSLSLFDILRGRSNDESAFGTDGMAVSPNGKIMVISVTNYETGKQNMDLYISRKGNSGQWSYPKLLSVNTKAEEISAFIAGDNKTLYFSSNRSGGLGGYDIYKTTLTEGLTCVKTINLGQPYNTVQDDYSFIVNSLDENGYLVRNGDILEFKLNDQAKPERTLIINGIVKTDKGDALDAKIKIFNKTGLIGTLNSNSYSGDYSFASAWENGPYTVRATLQDGQSKDINFDVRTTSKSPLNIEIVFPSTKKQEPEPIAEKTPTAQLSEAAEKLNKKELEAGKVILIDQLYFAADASTIQQNSLPILDEIAKVLANRKDIVIEIGGHTNNIPPDDYCDRLSTSRAKAVYDYLITKGVASTILRYKGYGKRNPIESNKTKIGRKKNQRVEFKVLKSEN